MKITFPERRETDVLDQLKLQSLWSMLELGDVSIRWSQKFPLILAEPNQPFRYFGRTILFFDVCDSPKAAAREVYGQHFVNMQGPHTAGRIARQITWLSNNQARLGGQNEEFFSVLLLAPNTGMFRLGLSNNRYKNIVHVLESDNGEGFTLINSAEYTQNMNRRFLARTQAIESLRRQARDNGNELPA